MSISRLTILIIFLTGIIFGQQSVENDSPCSNSILKNASEKGWYKLPPGEIPQYFKLRFKCWRESRGKGSSFKEQINRGIDGQRSQRPMHGWTSTHAAVVSVTWTIYYLHRNLK